jgi:uncharacterized membrane protein YkvI
MRARWPGLAATYVSAVVGAGFASGREAFHFFASYGARGLLGAVVAGALFSALGALALARVVSHGHRHGGDLFRDLCGPRLGWLVDRISLLGFVLVLAAVLSAAGALGHLLFGWPPWLGSGVFSAALAAAGLGGRRLFVTINLIATPGLLLALLALAVATVGRPDLPRTAVVGPIFPPWPLAAVLYVGYNLTLAVAGLCAAIGAPLGTREAATGGAVGGALLGVLCLAVVTALLPLSAPGAPDPGHLPLSAALTDPWWRLYAYPLLLVAALWTTGSAAAFAVAQRLAPAAPTRAAAVAPLLALPAALPGLTWLVGAGYPILGYAGLPLLGGIALLPWRAGPRFRAGRDTIGRW